MLLLALTLMLVTSVPGVPRVQDAQSYAISGEVRGSDGKPAAGVMISVQQGGLSPTEPRPLIRPGLSDANGHFMVKVERPGKYRVAYRDEEHGYMPQFTPFFTDPNNPPTVVDLTETTPQAHVNISMSKNGVLKGQAIDGQTQLPIENLKFVLCLTDRTVPCWTTSRKSADGKFALPTPFAPFILMVSSENYESWGGLNGNDPTGPISVAPGTDLELKPIMKRRPEAANRALSEAEKRPGINLPAPQLLSPADNQVFSIYPRATLLEWKPLEGAVSYAVEIDVCQARTRPQCGDPQPLFLPGNAPTRNLTTTSYQFNFVGAQPGRWRVWAVDKDGRDGFKSEWRIFVYLH
jgi:hypothetical protein